MWGGVFKMLIIFTNFQLGERLFKKRQNSRTFSQWQNTVKQSRAENYSEITNFIIPIDIYYAIMLNDFEYVFIVFYIH